MLCAVRLEGDQILMLDVANLFFLLVMLPSVLPRLATDSAVRVFPGIWKLLSF